MKDTPRDYTKLTAIAKNCGMVEYKKWGVILQGIYTIEGLEAPVDLSACAEDEKSILKTVLKQLSESIDNSYHEALERDTLN